MKWMFYNARGDETELRKLFREITAKGAVRIIFKANFSQKKNSSVIFYVKTYSESWPIWTLVIRYWLHFSL